MGPRGPSYGTDPFCSLVWEWSLVWERWETKPLLVYWHLPGGPSYGSGAIFWHLPGAN